jgi:hypothetical protein
MFLHCHQNQQQLQLQHGLGLCQLPLLVLPSWAYRLGAVEAVMARRRCWVALALAAALLAQLLPLLLLQHLLSWAGPLDALLAAVAPEHCHVAVAAAAAFLALLLLKMLS